MSLTAKLQALKIDDPTPKTILSGFKDTSLFAVWSVDNPDLAIELKKKGDIPTKSKMIKALTTSIREASAKAFIQPLGHAQLDKLLAPANITHKQEYTTRPPIPVLSKRLFEQFTRDNDLPGYLTAHFSGDLDFLKELAGVFDLTVEKKSDSAAVIRLIDDHVNLLGVHSYFSSIPVRILSDVAIAEKISKNPVTSAERLVAGLMSGQLPEPKKTNPSDMPTLEEIGDRKKIPKSDKWGLWQHYNLAELVKYCKDNDIKTSGTKWEVIDRIIAWREADKENKKKFMVSEVMKQRIAKRKSSTRKTTSTKKAAPSKKQLVESDSSEEDEPQSKDTKKSKSDEKPKDAKSTDSTKSKASTSDKDSKVTKVTESKESANDSKKKKVEAAESSKKTDTEPMETNKDEEGDVDDFVKIIDTPQNFSVQVLKEFCREQGIKGFRNKSKDELVKMINNTVLDLEHLAKYSKEALVDYCKTEDITYEGDPTQEELVKIVTEYNANDDNED
jgi:hypothetical protein